MRADNFPQSELQSLEPDFIYDTITTLTKLYSLPKCRNDEEIEQRIQLYFELCKTEHMRPGIESLSAALGYDRTTLFNWSTGRGCTEHRQEIIKRAKAMINSFLEQAVLKGKISPPSGIFLLKNWCGYRDSLSLEQSITDNNVVKELYLTETPREIMERRRSAPEKPEL